MSDVDLLPKIPGLWWWDRFSDNVWGKRYWSNYQWADWYHMIESIRVMKTAIYNVHTADGRTQEISINYTIVPEPRNVISEWCNTNKVRSFNCITPNKIPLDAFSWSYKMIEDGSPKKITCFAERMTWIGYYRLHHFTSDTFNIIEPEFIGSSTTPERIHSNIIWVNDSENMTVCHASNHPLWTGNCANTSSGSEAGSFHLFLSHKRNDPWAIPWIGSIVFPPSSFPL